MDVKHRPYCWEFSFDVARDGDGKFASQLSVTDSELEDAIKALGLERALFDVVVTARKDVEEALSERLAREPAVERGA